MKSYGMRRKTRKNRASAGNATGAKAKAAHKLAMRTARNTTRRAGGRSHVMRTNAPPGVRRPRERHRELDQKEHGSRQHAQAGPFSGSACPVGQ